MPEDKPIIKRARLIRPDANRNQQTVLALAASGLNQRQIAEKTGLSVKTVNRHCQSVKPALQTARNIVDDIADELAIIQSPRQIAENYAQLATSANNEAVRLGSQDRIVEIRGGITEKERRRTEKDAAREPGPMFVLPAGAHIAVTLNQTVNQVNTTIDSGSLPNNGAIEVKPLNPQDE